MRKRFGRNDIILISVIVIISVALLLIWKLVYLKGQDTDSDACVEVTIDGRAYGTYPLSKDDTIEIKNGDGDVTNTLCHKGWCGGYDLCRLSGSSVCEAEGDIQGGRVDYLSAE